MEHSMQWGPSLCTPWESGEKCWVWMTEGQVYVGKYDRKQGAGAYIVTDMGLYVN